jgi:hypothetical protein
MVLLPVPISRTTVTRSGRPHHVSALLFLGGFDMTGATFGITEKQIAYGTHNET